MTAHCFVTFMLRFESDLGEELLFINVFTLNRMLLKLSFSIYDQFLIFLCEKVIETITVYENGCSNVLF